jgi:hypothetical protein
VPAIDDPGACGIRLPVRVRSVAGVALDPPPVIACPTARRLRDWLEDAAKPAIAEAERTRLVGLDIAAAYVCRTVNYAEDAKVSEHARGRAIDISRFRLADGATISVQGDWDTDERGPLLREIHEAACGIFKTTLGPDSDAYHQDHFHFDTARRLRAYCP